MNLACICPEYRPGQPETCLSPGTHALRSRPSDTIAIVPEATSAVGKTLAKVPIFSGLTESELSFLAQCALPRSYSAGQSVFGEGEPCSGLYVVESGQVRIFKSSANGREQVLSIDGPGSSIAELPVFDGGSYPASVTAIDEAKLLFVSKQDFQALCLAHPRPPFPSPKKTFTLPGESKPRLATARSRLPSPLKSCRNREAVDSAKTVP